MRENLLTENENTKYIGTFIRYGSFYECGIKFKTVLIRNIRNKDGVVADHQWFKFNQGFAGLPLQEGDQVSFNADISAYTKGYRGKKKDIRQNKRISLDYQFHNLTNIQIVKNKKDVSSWQEAQ